MLTPTSNVDVVTSPPASSKRCSIRFFAFSFSCVIVFFAILSNCFSEVVVTSGIVSNV